MIDVPQHTGRVFVHLLHPCRNGVCGRLSVVNCSAENCPSVFGRNQFDFIVSNPPYIPSNEMRSLQPEILWWVYLKINVCAEVFGL